MADLDVLENLYSKNKDMGIIGVSFSELYELNKDDIDKCYFDGYKKFYYNKLLSPSIDKEFFSPEDYPIGFINEGCFVKSEDIDEFMNLVEKSKEYLIHPYTDECNNYVTIQREEIDNTRELVVKERDFYKFKNTDEIASFFTSKKLNKRDYSKKLSGRRREQQVDFEYAAAKLTAYVRPKAPMTKETSAAIGGALYGGAGAILGYAAGKEKQDQYNKSLNSYIENESRRKAVLARGPQYSDVDRFYSGQLALLALPMGYIPILLLEKDSVNYTENIERKQKEIKKKIMTFVIVISVIVSFFIIFKTSKAIYRNHKVKTVTEYLVGKEYSAKDSDDKIIFIDNDTCKISDKYSEDGFNTSSWKLYWWDDKLHLDIKNGYKLSFEIDLDNPNVTILDSRYSDGKDYYISD